MRNHKFFSCRTRGFGRLGRGADSDDSSERDAAKTRRESERKGEGEEERERRKESGIGKPIYTMSSKMVKSAMPPRLKAVNGRLGKCEDAWRGVASLPVTCHPRVRERKREME